MKYKNSKVLCIILSIVMLFMVNNVVVMGMTEIDKNSAEYIMNAEGPSVTYTGELTRNESGAFSGQIRSGITTVTCILSGNTGGISTLYNIYIKWNGTNQVQSIQADKLWILNTSITSPVTYYYKSFFISGLSSYNGYSSVGTCTIPDDVDTVRVRTIGLQAYFYNEDYWVSLGEINEKTDI